MTRLWLSALTLTLAVSSIALGQAGVEKREVSLQMPQLGTIPAWKLVRLDRSGELTLKPERSSESLRHVTEGYYILLPVAPRAKGMARVTAVDVGLETLTVKTSPEAAKAFAEGDSVRLVRPFPTTTEQLRSIPEAIAIPAGAEGVDEALGAARDLGNSMRSTINLRQIALAMHIYVSVHDRLPPAVVRGPDGKPMHSWRVLILPHIDQQALYDRYDFSQPWDSAKNLKLLDEMPAVYRDPADADARSHVTHYAVLSGEGTPFPPEGAPMKGDGKAGLQLEPDGLISFAQVLDGTSNTIAAVPVPPGRKIPWTKPEDIRFDEDFPALGDPKGIALPYKVDGVRAAPVLFMDGSVKTLSAKTNPAIVNALATRAGGEIVPADAFGQAAARPGGATLTIIIEGGKATATIR